MPRRPRLELPGIPLHITQRGVNRCAIFIDDDDRRHYLELLARAIHQYAVAIHAYVLMGNHVHLLANSNQPGAISLALRNLGQCYVQAFNRKHRRCGALWQGRFKSCLVDNDRYLLSVHRYIELNPVRAAMVASPEDYPWSSVHAHLGRCTDPLLTPHPGFLALHPQPAMRADIYRDWLRRGVGDEELASIRAHLDQERAWGSQRFQQMAEKTLGRPVRLKRPGRPRKEAGQEGEGAS